MTTDVTIIDASVSPWLRCLYDFMQSVRDRSGSDATVAAYSSVLNRFFSVPLEVKSPANYTRADVEAFLHRSYAGEQEIGPSTRNQRLSALNALYKYAQNYSITGPDGRPMMLFQAASPAIGIRYSQTPRPRHVLSSAQIAAFFAIIPRDTVRGARDFSLYWSYFCTARRLSELQQLRWGDIEEAIFDNGRAGHLFKFRGKGKSREIDTQELPVSCYDAIVRYLEMSGRLASIEADDPVWRWVGQGDGTLNGPQWDPFKPLTGRTVNRNIREYAKKAGLSEAVTCHWFRHSSARERYRASQDVLAVQRTLRHASLDMTQRYLSTILTVDDPGGAELEARFLAR